MINYKYLIIFSALLRAGLSTNQGSAGSCRMEPCQPFKLPWPLAFDLQQNGGPKYEQPDCQLGGTVPQEAAAPPADDPETGTEV